MTPEQQTLAWAVDLFCTNALAVDLLCPNAPALGASVPIATIQRPPGTAIVVGNTQPVSDRFAPTAALSSASTAPVVVWWRPPYLIV